MFVLAQILAQIAFAQNVLKTLGEFSTDQVKEIKFPRLEGAQVDHYTGAFRQSYTIFENKYVGKIDLAYEGSGLKVANEASQVGAGWNISTHPTITREIRGISDLNEANRDQKGYIFTDIALPSYSGTVLSNLKQKIVESTLPGFVGPINVAITNWDTEPDIFTLSLHGRSIKFILPQRGQLTTINAILLDKSNKVIIKYNVGAYNFEVTDENGTVYTFDIKDYVLTATSGDGVSPRYGIGDLKLILAFNDIPNIVQWNISKALSHTGELVSYTYTRVHRGESPVITQSVNALACLVGTPDGSQAFQNSYSVAINEYSAAQIDEIVFPEGVLKFQYSERKDLPTCGSYPYFTNLDNAFPVRGTGNAQKLDRIILRDKAGTVVENTSLSYSYFNQGRVALTDNEASKMLRLKLDTVKIGPEKFWFSYIKSDSLPSKLSNSIDLWGYHNGITNSGRVPRQVVSYYCLQNVLKNCNACTTTIDFQLFPYLGNRSVREEAAKIGGLEFIRSSIGGYIQVEYEGNEYLVNKDDSTRYGQYVDERSIKEYVALYDSSPTQTDVFEVSVTKQPFIEFYYACSSNFDGSNPGSHYKCDMIFSDTQKKALEVVNATTGAVVKTRLFFNSGSPVSVADLPAGQYYIRFWSLYNPWNFFMEQGNDYGKIYHFASQVKVTTNLFDGANYVNIEAGGLRVKSLRYFDGATLIRGSRFNYSLFGTGKSSGKPSHYLVNHFTQAKSVTEYYSQPNVPPRNYKGEYITFTSDFQVSTGNGPAIGYSNVEEIPYSSTVENGKTRYIFYNLKNVYSMEESHSSIHVLAGDVNPIRSYYQHYPKNSYAHINGKVKKTVDYNAAGTKVREVENTYENDFYNFSKVVGNGGKVRTVVTESTGSGSGTFYTPVTYYQYTIYDFTNPLISTKEILVDASGNAVTETINSYKANYNLDRTILKTSQGQDLTTIYTYPNDAGASSLPQVANLVSKNMVGSPLVLSKVRNGKEVYRYESTYSLFYNKFLLVSNENIKANSTEARGEFVYDYEDSFGKLRTSKSLKFPQVTYLWGYGGQYVVARIENATYAEVLTVMGQTAINGLRTNNNSASISTTIKNLRNDPRMRMAKVTGFTYSPLVGMTSLTNARGNTESFYYDGFKRLKYIVDLENFVLNDYQYNFRF